MTARGIRSSSARTVTQTFCGKFREDWNLQRLITEGVK
jgi:GTP cyclohydrolase I